jgi:hypothetical protein
MDVNRIVKTFALVAVFVALLALGTILVGCSAKEVLAAIETTEKQAAGVIDVKAKVDQLLKDAQAGIVPEQQLIVRLIDVLPAELKAKAAGLYDRGMQSVLVAAEVSQALSTTAEGLFQHLEELKLRLAEKQADDDATREVVYAIAGGVAGLFGVGGPVSLILSRISRRQGEQQGAAAVAKVVQLGRNTDPALDSAFRTGAAHDAMKNLLDQQSWAVFNGVAQGKAAHES